MPEYEVTLTFKGEYDEAASAFEHGDLAAHYVEKADPSLAVDVTLRELNP